MYSKEQTTIIDRREMLRVKVKSLGDEARIIRKEELRTHGQMRFELWHHRVSVVRSEARHAHLALGFIRGRSLEQMEPKSDIPPQWDKIHAMCKKYGPKGMPMPSKDTPEATRSTPEALAA
jgi:hypothetical protein